jgi:ABC-type polysaccharide/polyol phosphate transport system ATPase subunit
MLSLISSQATDILILNEVLDGADYFFQQKISVRMKQFIASAGATVFISHSADQIREICDQVLVMNKGKIGFLGQSKKDSITTIKIWPQPSHFFLNLNIKQFFDDPSY